MGRIGIDLGGTKIEALAMTPAGIEAFRARLPTPRHDYGATIETIAKLVREGRQFLGRCTVGIGIPGAISPATGLVKNANSVWLNGRPLREDLRHRLMRDVRIANDANCFALSEAVDGAAAGARVVFGVIVGTGTGGGLAIDREPVVGANAIAGEWGHNPLPWPEPGEWPGEACYCGRTGCIETYLSGPALSRDYAGATGEVLDAREIAARAQGGEAAANAALERYERRMARALASIVNVLDPDVIVLGGGLSNIARLYTNVPRLWGDYIFSDAVATRFVRAAHGDASGVRGAAWLWGREEG